MQAWLLANLARVGIYVALAVAIGALLELDGYRRGQLQLYEYKAEQAQLAVTIVTKTRMIENDAVALLQEDYDTLRILYERLRDTNPGAGALSDAADNLEACRRNAGERDTVQDARRMLADVESAVLGILEAGDTEIAKYRALYKRDEALARIAF